MTTEIEAGLARVVDGDDPPPQLAERVQHAVHEAVAIDAQAAAKPRELWRGELDGFPFWHDEGGNTVRIAPSTDGGVYFWVSEYGNESGPRLMTDDVRDLAAHLVQLCDRIDADATLNRHLDAQAGGGW